jgi:uncharacterized paraquat-inducible protein A
MYMCIDMFIDMFRLWWPREYNKFLNCEIYLFFLKHEEIFIFYVKELVMIVIFFKDQNVQLIKKKNAFKFRIKIHTYYYCTGTVGTE